MPALKRILVADTSQGITTLHNVIGEDAEIVEAAVLEDAILQVSRGVNLIVCGIHFQESRMFDLLRIAKADPATRSIPFICFRDMDSALTPAILESLQIACNALGAVDFVDLFHLKVTHGLKDADAHFRKLMLASMLEGCGE